MKFVQPTDENAWGQLQDLAAEMPLEELRKHCEVMMNTIVIFQDQFRKRFPAEWERWQRGIGKERP